MLRMNFCRLLLVVSCVAVESCSFGEWSECETVNGCNSPQDYNPDSWKQDVSNEHAGHVLMEEMMQDKLARTRYRRQCRAEGTCPKLTLPPSRTDDRCSRGFAGGYPCSNMDLVSFINFVDMAGKHGEEARGNDIWGWVDPETNAEIAIMGMTTGTAFVDVTNARNPRPIAFMKSHLGISSLWRDMKVIGDYVYVVSEAENHGLQIFDLRRLRAIKHDLEFVEPDVHYGGFGQAHNVVANEETHFIYGVGSRDSGEGMIVCEGGLHVIDVSTPTEPVFRGCFGEDGYVHDAQCVIYRGPDIDHYGREICFCYNVDSLTIVDVSDKEDMFVIRKQHYEGASYTHQGWLTDDQRALLLDDEADEYYGTDKRTRTYFWDIEDLDRPILRNVHISDTTAIDHNQYIFKGHVYQSNYEAGLRVLRVDQELFELTEVAYFDVYPPSTTADYQNGTWSNYPYLPSENILVSSMDYGMFVLSLDEDAIQSVGKQRRVQGYDCQESDDRRSCSYVC